VVEFGWVVALPEASATDSYFHVKYASERSGERRAADSAEERRGANLGQAIFHRPASSGAYALVCSVETARIGFNDITQTYAVDDAQRQARYRALLESLLYTFVQPNGAMRGTQHPHMVDLTGVVSLSHELVPAPTLSPLNEDYETELARIAEMLNKIRPGAIELRNFDSLAGFSAIMADLIESTAAYKLAFAA
jgi:CRISPR-associated protein Cst2